MTLKEGNKAPDLKLTDDTGKPFKLSDLRGKTVVLYFYPGADTPTCTQQSCEFRDYASEFAAKGAVIVGVSPDTVKAQAKFKKKFELPFTLVADADHSGAEKYGIWKEKTMFGNTYMGVERTTLIIDPDGRIKKIFPKVRLKGHIDAVLAAL